MIEILILIHFGFFWRCGYRYESTRKNEGFKVIRLIFLEDLTQ